MGRIRIALIALTLAGAMLAQVPGAAQEPPPPEEDDIIAQVGRGLTVPAGFVSRVFAQPPIVPTTLTWGPDTTADGALLYVGGVSGNPISCDGCGQVIAISDEGTMSVAADGLDSILGIAFGPGNTLWVADNQSSRGRISALNDTDADGVFETSRVVLHNIPNGRHQTNGLTFGPDGMLYVANGNATDNGLKCGPPLGPADPLGLPEPAKSIYESTFRNTECADPEIAPWTGSVIRVNPEWTEVDLMEDVRLDEDRRYAEDGLDDENVLAAEGFRNIYDLDFRPGHGDEIWTAMNGPDNPSGSEPVYGFPVNDEVTVAFDEETGEPIMGPNIEDAGFPSCLYDPHENPFPEPTTGHDHDGIPEPQDTTDPDVKAAFGPCPKDTVLPVRTVLENGHEGTSGISFTRGDNFPPRYEGDLFVAEWGSLWNLNGVPTYPSGVAVNGHKILHLDVREDGTVGRQREFMTGALPIDVTFGPNGFMYVADMSGQIHEVRHVPELETQDEVAVAIEDGHFAPPALTLVRGQTVRWVNMGTATQDVTFQNAALLIDQLNGEDAIRDARELRPLNSGDLEPGDEYTLRFDIPGTYHYSSSTGGAAMQGTIVVTTMER